jgi:hypothetical protein
MIVRSLVMMIVTSTFAIAEKPAALTADEIRDGWILLFDGESTFGWSTTGSVTADAGKLTLAANASGQAQIPKLPPGELRFNGSKIEHSKHDFVHFMSKSADPLLVNEAKYRPQDMTPLFNGKDLTGWTVFAGDAKRKASKFEVTAAGELRVTNGPGDLQSIGTYSDFLLQFECKTQGDSLNSGFFFRCLPDQYQQGYEAQIQNAIVNNDASKPADFGTGAIYRRIAARKVVSKDREWFTMTVVAVGPLLRTWVNGYPVVNWTDDRKPADNARQGQYLKAGHISIQGHDPTTDILFRNIRITPIK